MIKHEDLKENLTWFIEKVCLFLHLRNLPQPFDSDKRKCAVETRKCLIYEHSQFAFISFIYCS